MENYKDDNSQDIGTFFFLILFFVFVLASSGNPESNTSPSAKYPLQNELVSGDISTHNDAAILNPVNLPNIQKHCECALHNTSLNLFSLQLKRSNYNNRTTQIFINGQKARLVIEPLFLWRLYRPISLSEKEDLPVLS